MIAIALRPILYTSLSLPHRRCNITNTMSDNVYAAPTGPPPPKVPEGWKAVWNDQYKEW